MDVFGRLIAKDPSISSAFANLFAVVESGAIDLEDTERRLSRAFDAVAYPEDPGSHFRNLQIARMKRKQAARETGADYGRSTTGDLIGDKADQYGDVDRQGIEDVA